MIVDNAVHWYNKYKDLPTKKIWSMYLRRTSGKKEVNTNIAANGQVQKLVLSKLLKERGEL